MLRSSNNAMPRTSHTTRSAGSLRRRTDAVPVAAKASSIHCGSIAAANCSKLAGRAPAPTARMASPNPIAPTSCGGDQLLPVEKKIQNPVARSEEHTSELQSRVDLVCRLLLEKKKKNNDIS